MPRSTVLHDHLESLIDEVYHDIPAEQRHELIRSYWAGAMSLMKAQQEIIAERGDDIDATEDELRDLLNEVIAGLASVADDYVDPSRN